MYCLRYKENESISCFYFEKFQEVGSYSYFYSEEKLELPEIIIPTKRVVSIKLEGDCF